jgi:diguanylate cyclase (GGDEF)-like protein
MIEQQSTKDLKFIELKALVEKGGERVSASDLRKALALGQITAEQHTLLSEKVEKEQELIKEGLTETSRRLAIQLEESGIDPVTKLSKLISLKPRLEKLINELNLKRTSEEMRENRRPPLGTVIVIAVDLDNLKIWNNYGHDKGNEALKAVADCTKKSIRSENGDLAFRLGDKSDELVVILRIEKDLTAEECRTIFEKFKSNINSGYVEVGVEKLPVTAAAGYVVLKNGESRTPDEILKAADQIQVLDKEPDVKQKRINTAKEKLNRIK